MKFAEGGLVPKPETDSVFAVLAPGTVLVKESVWKNSKDKIMARIHIGDKIKVIDDELWDRLTPSEKGKLL